MKYLKISLIFALLFILQGCVVPGKPAYQSTYKKEVLKKPSHVEKTNSQIYVNTKSKNIMKKANYTGSIRGIIQSIKYDKVKKSWLYKVKGIDVSHAKLPYARFYHNKKLANKGDLVYIILKDSNLQNLFFIKKVNKVTRKIKKRNKKKILFKNNKRVETPWIGLPRVEHVIF